MTNSRSKGVRGELEASRLLSALFGLPVHRGQQYKGGPDSPDVIGIDGLHFEIKRCERLSIYKSIEQAKNDAGPDDVPLVLFRKNRENWLAILEAGDLISLAAAILKLAKRLNNNQQEAEGG